MGQYKKVRGMHDIMPEEIEKWHFVEKIISETVNLFNYSELRTPVIEEQALFERSVGMETDIVSKEMYTFQDKKGRKLALRPEGTASTVRAYIESTLSSLDGITRLYYYGPMFRYDRPQKGRYRQFYQFGVELFGGALPFYDGEVIEILNTIMSNLGIKGVYFDVNTLGCKDCKSRYTEIIKGYVLSIRDRLCEDCKVRSEKSPLRIMDCKNPVCGKLTENIPSIQGILCQECADYFTTLLGYLQKKGIEYNVRSNLVRGLDYYTKTVFEVFLKEDKNAIAAGGRYDLLVKELGGKETPAVGFAIGMERLLELVEKKAPVRSKVYIISMGEQAKQLGLKISGELRKEKIPVEMDYDEKSLKTSLKRADRGGFGWSVILGEREIEKGIIVLKNMVTGTQQEVQRDNCAQTIKNII
jgi:histidyl-tRNA synthetase